MNYLVIKNGFVVKGSAIITEDILVGGNKILQMGLNIERPTGETPVIDAAGKYVMPGAIDVHRHFLDRGSDKFSLEELKRLNQAEIYNGTTTMIDAIGDYYEKNYLYNIYKAKQKAQHNLIDYSFHLTFSELKTSVSNAFDYSYIHEGISTFLLTLSLLENLNVNILEAIVKRAAQNHLLIICDLIIPEVQKSGIEDVKLNQPLALQHHFEALSLLVEMGLKYSCPLMFLNVKFDEELVMIEEGIASGGDFFVSLSMPFSIDLPDRERETEGNVISKVALHNGLHPIHEDEIWVLLKNKRFLVNPPSFSLSMDEGDEEALAFNRPDKFFYMRNYLSMLYTAGVNEGKINIMDLVDIVSVRPAKVMGLWPKKGILQPGADADFVIWNATFERNLYGSMLNGQMTSLKRHKLRGRPDFVFAKGKMVYNGETFYPNHSDGAFVYRAAPVLK